MGVKNLWDILESCKKTLPLHHLQNKRVCIDLSCWIVQLQNVNKSHCAIKDKLYLRGLFHRLRALIALNCSLIFVTDGAIPAIKSSTYRRRLNPGNVLTQDEAIKPSSIRRNAGSEFSRMIKEAKVLGNALGIPCLDGIEEAEAQCAVLNYESFCDGCFTSDSDVFLFGARTVYRDICLGEGGYLLCYEMDDIERKLGLGRNSLITLAVILGGDYSEGVYGLGRESACQIVKSIGDSAVLQWIASEGFSFVKKQKGSKKKIEDDKCNGRENAAEYKNPNGSKCPSQMKSQTLQVLNAYLKPKCHSAESDAVQRILVLYPYIRSQLQQICTEFLDWPPEKTDEYILPKIAERELRRFANLRSTASQLGVQLPLNEMPIKCPLSRIIKPRKVQGVDCFEVSWEEMDGLETSIVPADLVQRACPERILEFQERRVQGKKRNNTRSRRPRLEKMPPLGQIDQKLQDLLLEVDRESSAADGATVLFGSASEDDESIAQIHIDSSIQTHSTWNSYSVKKGFASGSPICQEDDILPALSKAEVIDLTSPPPVRHGSGKSKHQEEDNVECIDVIELSDSENDMFSPEHIRRARELRMFIAGIKDKFY
ncbi:single-strand DNA endonuclease 1 [Nicotiana tomentosiformis]|uniref:single-strand DNA endonuclease 1 n=1 Tax=Nicotiana tomentosiformis TaxID=4098 RepID=UPI00051B4850|nr:flap endonuclease GEN-like 2 isoform X1 [Nicotiana tomentosiformis]